MLVYLVLFLNRMLLLGKEDHHEVCLRYLWLHL